MNPISDRIQTDKHKEYKRISYGFIQIHTIKQYPSCVFYIQRKV